MDVEAKGGGNLTAVGIANESPEEREARQAAELNEVEAYAKTGGIPPGLPGNNDEALAQVQAGELTPQEYIAAYGPVNLGTASIGAPDRPEQEVVISILEDAAQAYIDNKILDQAIVQLRDLYAQAKINYFLSTRSLLPKEMTGGHSVHPEAHRKEAIRLQQTLEVLLKEARDIEATLRKEDVTPKEFPVAPGIEVAHSVPN